MDEQGLALDFSHMDEQAFWQALEVFQGPVCATHSNPRALLGGGARVLQPPPERCHDPGHWCTEWGDRHGVV